MRVVVAVFAAVGLLSGTAEIVSAIAAGHDLRLPRTLIHAEGVWLLYAALSPLAFWASRRFPLERSRVARNAPAHGLALMAISLVHTLVYTTTTVLLAGGDAARVFEVIGSSWIRNLRADVFVYTILVGGYYLYAYGARAKDRVGDDERQPAFAAPEPPMPSPPDRLAVKDRGGITFVDVDDIEWIEADGDYVRVRAGTRSHLVRETLTAMERSLDPQRFLRIHRSTIVSLSNISELKPHQHGECFVVTTSGAKLKVSRSYRAALATAVKVRL